MRPRPRAPPARPPLGPQDTAAVSPSVHDAGAKTRMRALFAGPSRIRTATVMSTVRLKPGHVQPVWAGHPWIYAQAVDSIDPGVAPGDEVRVVDPRGNLLGRGFYSSGSAIPVRILARDETTQFDAAFFRARFDAAVALRSAMGLPDSTPGLETDGYRLVHAEGDNLPGLVVDRYGDTLAVQFGTIGMKQREAMIREALRAATGARTILDRTSAQTAKMEGFD